jgi:hypothetical protein
MMTSPRFSQPPISEGLKGMVAALAKRLSGYFIWCAIYPKAAKERFWPLFGLRLTIRQPDQAKITRSVVNKWLRILRRWYFNRY